MCFDYDDYAEFADVRPVTAKKPHRCSVCRSKIPAGARYERFSGKGDGGFFVEKWCRRCCYDRVRIVEHELAEGCSWSESWPAAGDVIDYLLEHDMGQTRPEDVPAGFQVGDQPRTPTQLKESAPT